MSKILNIVLEKILKEEGEATPIPNNTADVTDDGKALPIPLIGVAKRKPLEKKKKENE